METTIKKLYEAMFLVDSAQAGSDWDGTMATINRVLERAEAEVVTIRKWADRKLAYEIERKSRGTYVLCFFKAAPSKISGMEKDVLLSENIMRAMITSTEGRSENVLERDIKGEAPAPKDQDYENPYDRNDRNDRNERNERSDRVRSIPKTEAEEVKAAAAKQEAAAKAAAKASEDEAAKASEDEAAKASEDEAGVVADGESSPETETTEETPAS